MGLHVLILWLSAGLAKAIDYQEDVESTSNNSHKTYPNIKCYAPLQNTSTHLLNYNAVDGGVPQTFGLNCLGWALIMVLFCVIRRLVWDYGRLAVTQKEDLGWTSVFYGLNVNGNGKDKQEDKPSVTFPEVKDKGLLSWVPVLLRVTDEHIHVKCGMDALQYIQFQKHLIVYSVIIFCLSIGIVLPINYSGTNEYERNSFGATTVSNLEAQSSMFWLHAVFALLYIIIIVVILRHFTSLFNMESLHESATTVMITNIPKNVTKELIQQHFVEVYDDSMIEEVQLAYNCDKLQSIERKLEAARLGREHCQELLQLNGERPQTTVSPCMMCCGVKHVDGIEYFTEVEGKARAEFEQTKQSLKSLGVAFVTFVNEETSQKCLKDFNTIKHGSPESSVSRKIFSDHWNVASAPLTGDILWEHLSVDPESWWARALIINIILFIFVLFITTPTVLITSFNEIKASIVEKNPKLRVAPNPFFTQFLPTIMLWTFSAILPVVVSYSSYFEAHWTRSRLEHSVMIKTYVFLLLMVIVLPSLALTSADALFQVTLSGSALLKSRLACVFLPNNGAFFVNYLVTSALIGTALELCRFPELAAYAVRMCFAKDEGEKRLVRRESVREFAFGHQYAWMIVIFSVMVVYSIACPLVTPFGLLYLTFKHVVDRYNLYFNYRSPAYKYVDPSVHSTAVVFTIISSFFLLLSILFFGVVRLGINDPQTIFTIVLVALTLAAFVGRVAFGFFKRLGPFKQRLNNDEEDHITEVYMPEAYLPPVLRSKRESAAASAGEDSSPPQLTRRKTYGTTSPTVPYSGAADHVIDADQLTPSSETIVSMSEEERR
ncbi:CSC1-like protein 2 isoform X2 [Nematostella vectensis]|uniref:CSC1-like protein 2 isoform X2 n=1 Tax=Nematostella vectensis TaxID=45351 RepID=UPI002077015F|nr:CSC1-like protein 2 isoform X2 [Nematostella vectensis]